MVGRSGHNDCDTGAIDCTEPVSQCKPRVSRSSPNSESATNGKCCGVSVCAFLHLYKEGNRELLTSSLKDYGDDQKNITLD